MKIPKDKFDNLTDADVQVFLHAWDEPAGASVLEIGCHDESVDSARILAECGYQVLGVDLRPIEPPLTHPNFALLVADFCRLPAEDMATMVGKVDSIYSLSTLEHFGYNVYQEGWTNTNYDSIACHVAWQLLKPGGTFYLSVPFGRDYIENYPHWRVYNYDHLYRRLVQGFTTELTIFFFSAPGSIFGTEYKSGQLITRPEAMCYSGNPPHATVLLGLKKPLFVTLPPLTRV